MSDIKRQLNQLKSKSSAGSGDRTDLKSKLNRVYHKGSNGERFFPEEQVVRAHKRLEELVPGAYINTPFGDIYRARTTFPLSYLQGNSQLAHIRRVTPERLIHLGRLDPDTDLDIGRLLFLDTEASGLSGGTGTYAFMIGVGYFSGEDFVVDQLFVENYVKEEGMLDLLRVYLEDISCLVTFNGKSFDTSLLQTRYLMHGQESPFEEIPHLDLLHPCRNLWDLSVENCKLQTLEREILEFIREEDTPGAEVPGIYFDFIRTGDPTEIAGVFQHNVLDIVSLVAITTVLEQNFQGSIRIPNENGLTKFSRGKIYERQKQYESALEWYQAALEDELSGSRRQIIMGRMAALLKKQGKWDAALPLWKNQISEPLFVLEPFVELAKYFEHHSGEFRKALQYTQSALDQLPQHRVDDRQELLHRLARLEKKMERTDASA